MSESDQSLLQTLLVAQVVHLGKTLRTEDLSKGKTVSGTGYYEKEAIKLIRAQRPLVLQLLAELPPAGG